MVEHQFQGGQQDHAQWRRQILHDLKESSRNLSLAIKPISGHFDTVLVEGVDVDKLLKGISKLKELKEALIGDSGYQARGIHEETASLEALKKKVSSHRVSLEGLHEAVDSDLAWKATPQSVDLVLEAFQCCHNLNDDLAEFITESLPSSGVSSSSNTSVATLQAYVYASTSASTATGSSASGSISSASSQPQRRRDQVEHDLRDYWQKSMNRQRRIDREIENAITNAELDSLMEQTRPLFTRLRDPDSGAPIPRDFQVLILGSSDSAMLFHQANFETRESVSSLRRFHKKKQEEGLAGCLEQLSIGLLRALASSPGSTWAPQAIAEFLKEGDALWQNEKRWQDLRATVKDKLSGRQKGLVVLCKNIILLAGATVGDSSAQDAGTSEKIAHVLAGVDKTLEWTLVSSESSYRN
eukprot:CAMPEP_0178413314 /NCGR_PEP_ID=MMETSP0689_2-20121128/22465_1 /TAXON_ID=160604 /ORGANISM="Amphidinium massartii, Strain CS-259" /LENGTH=412 /DNA_ID=CAMNT_0020034585 /DNA_START=44 /DNA_END=1279 /DNA_ORIENTATION=-